ncbi:MAG: hypothetical protein IJ037_11710, partial [Clostridia bacterium]|nr:hypothetical protein [Clostridia bacterium]
MLEAMNADSYYSTSIAYYDVMLQGRAMRDQDSCEMLDIIRASRTVDPELAYNFLGVSNLYNDVLGKKSTESLASAVKSSQKMAERKIAKFAEIYQ